MSSQVREILEKLIAFDTTSEKTNLPFLEYVKGYLLAQGVKDEHITFMKAADGIHANFFATLPAVDGTSRGGVILSGHSDVVPVTGQKWDTDPFTLTDKGDGRLYGRGACDMKGFLAVVLALVPHWKKTPLAKPIHIAMTYCEETDFTGILQFEKEGKGLVAGCEAVILGEPTLMDLVIAHKGIIGDYVTFTGRTAHSSLQTSGYSALLPATRFTMALFELQRKYATEGPFEEGYTVPYSSLNPAVVQGGVGLNNIAETCRVGYELRNVPALPLVTAKAQVRALIEQEAERVRAEDPEASVVEGNLFEDISPFNGNPKARVVKVLADALAGRRPHEGVVRESFSTEAGNYQGMGVDAVVCGPGSLEQAHKANEFVSVEQLLLCEETLKSVLQTLCGAPKCSSL